MTGLSPTAGSAAIIAPTCLAISLRVHLDTAVHTVTGTFLTSAALTGTT